MKILFITNQSLQGHGGGVLSAKKVLKCLEIYKHNHQIDDYLIISCDNFANSESIVVKKTIVKDILARLLFKSNFLFFDIRKNLKKIASYSPNIIILHNSRFGFMIPMLKKVLPNVRIISMFENIETDYCRHAVSPIALPLEHFIVFCNEKKTIRLSNGLVFLNSRDKKRAIELFKINFEHSFLFPVTLEKPNSPLKIITSKPTLVFLGTLNYLPNEKAVLYFINNIWDKLDQSQFDVFIAGKNPNKSLIESCKKASVRIINGFNQLSDFCPIGACLISPLQSGSGMKTKVAEALSYGMYVIGSEETFIGYENILNKNSLYVHVSKTEADYVKMIQQYRTDFLNQLTAIGDNNIKLFDNLYSTEKYVNRFFDFLTQYE